MLQRTFLIYTNVLGVEDGGGSAPGLQRSPPQAPSIGCLAARCGESQVAWGAARGAAAGGRSAGYAPTLRPIR
jgi:hypothetical protein